VHPICTRHEEGKAALLSTKI